MSSEKVPYEITHACGHKGTIQIFVGSNPDKSSWVMAQRQRECRDCYSARLIAVDGEMIARGKRAPLEGSDQQVTWAQRVRQQRAVALRDWLVEMQARGEQAIRDNELSQREHDEAVAEVRAAFADLMMGVEFSDEDYDHSGYAKWWIDGSQNKRDTASIIAELLPDRDVLGTGVWRRLGPDGWSTAAPDTVVDATLLPIEVVEVDEPARTATWLPGTQPPPFNPHARGGGRAIKSSAGPAAAKWDRDEVVDLEDAPF